MPSQFDAGQDWTEQLSREWLLSNGRGGFASGTVVGVPTRRYHGLLVASARPPLERWLLLSAVLERVDYGEQFRELAAFDFGEVVHPRGFEALVDFTSYNAGPWPWAQFTYAWDALRVVKCVYLPRGRDEVVVRYRVTHETGGRASLGLCPFVAIRDFHGVTQAFGGGFPVEERDGAVWVGGADGPRLRLCAEAGESGERPVFEHGPDWWRGFAYREEAARGFDGREDLFVPGWFRVSGEGAFEVTLRAEAVFGQDESDAQPTSEVPAQWPEPREARVEERLTAAADAFVVERRRADGGRSTTILAGYPWFGDWGRDTFIALPGLLLETGRFIEARQVLETFASTQRDGLIPNRFSDYGDGCDYNSVDASLWYIHAADAYCHASSDAWAWREVLGPTCERIVEAFAAGTQFNIHMDDDGLLSCGDESTQLTWMDAKHGDTAFTPRYGKPVEINALWYHALCILAERSGPRDKRRGSWYTKLAERTRKALARDFWNAEGECLYDVVREGYRDAAVRPNQVFAVSLPHSALSKRQQRAVVDCVERELLTPYGLRSLSPRDPAYRGRYAGNSWDRDSAYHQGTVWGWLIGPYVEAYLRVHGFAPAAMGRMRSCLQSLVDHLDEAGLGSVSEVFDGDPPHRPGGCIAQAWSVAELLRAWRMTGAEKAGG